MDERGRSGSDTRSGLSRTLPSLFIAEGRVIQKFGFRLTPEHPPLKRSPDLVPDLARYSRIIARLRLGFEGGAPMARRQAQIGEAGPQQRLVARGLSLVTPVPHAETTKISYMGFAGTIDTVGTARLAAALSNAVNNG